MAIAPDKPSLSVNPLSYNCAVHYGLTSFGDPNSGTLELRRNMPIGTPIATKTTIGDFVYNDSSCWSNHSYIYYAKANNGELSTSADPVTVVTLPPNFSISGNIISASNATENSFDVLWHPVALGSEYQVDLYASIDEKQTWVLVAQNIQNATDYTYTFTGLNEGTTYKVYTQSRDSIGRSVDATKTTTITTLVNPKLYGSVNGQAKEIKKLYGPVNTTSYEVTGLSDNPGFDASTFMSKWETEYGPMMKEPDYISIKGVVGGEMDVIVYFSDAPYVVIFSYESGSYNDEGLVWGFAQKPEYGNFTYATTPVLATKEITKLYGSVNGQTKLVYEAQQ